MRRDNRKKDSKQGLTTDKIIFYLGIGVVILAAIVISLFMYSKGLNDDVKNSTMSLEQMASLENKTQDTQSASTEMGKTVEESANELNTINTTNTVNTAANDNTRVSSNIISNSNNTISNKTNSINTVKSLTNSIATSTNKTNTKPEKQETQVSKQESKKELKFEKPVEGEVVREFAKDNLIYSETLKEWATHLGIDIKAEKTTVVKSAEQGTVKSIKNDPRYGLTIVIEHENGFQTIYSNLLTSEFVVEGEKVEKGQSIGTVGNTAMFEIADEPHLHFEILKNGIQEDPSIYLK